MCCGQKRATLAQENISQTSQPAVQTPAPPPAQPKSNALNGSAPCACGFCIINNRTLGRFERTPRPIGAERARLNHDHLDTERRTFLCKRLGQAPTANLVAA